ncbi:tripartite tricarboxylate transporter substrate binding protein [Diaphorobacter sp. JS3050]|uniref:Bug family tripartite tricarboxylate transporter substrate binding protein n=1 Tax=Diaphorobacter sp. JS3050 TaxID=2735554 RepID=UPI00155550B4|nr:tripartite tricarboxylate transporter substrate binding protein [Diaphorobacter sp. JS3050]QJY33124.1 tripartite tricarboxylate transporter substrate binding protein [Diaphorobacter sp. JS3050]
MLPLMSSAQHSAYPSKPVRIVVPFAAGTSSDSLTRVIAEELSERLKQPFLIENRPGAGGNIGTEFVARSPADGYTLLMASTPNIAINPTLYTHIAIDPQNTLRAVGLAMSAPNLIVAGNKVPFHDFAGMVAYAKSHPRKLSYSTYANGSTGHLAGAMLNVQAGIDLLHVAAKDPLSLAVGEHVELAIVTPTATLPLVRAGSLKAIAVTSIDRISIAREIPTVSESGLKGFDAVAWYGYVAPIRTPDAVVSLIESQLQSILRSSKMKDFAKTTGNEITWRGASDFSSFMVSERAKWGDAVRQSGAQVS